MKFLKALLPVFITLAPFNSALASSTTFFGYKGNYTIDTHALTYQGCTDAGCISLNRSHLFADNNFATTWEKGEYLYQISWEAGEIRVYKGTQLIFSDKLLSKQHND